MISIIIKTVGAYSSIVPLLLGIRTFKVNSPAIRYLVVLSGIACITEVIAVYLGLRRIPNLFLFHFYPPIEFCLLLTIYALHTQKHVSKSIYWGIGGAFVVFSIVNTLFFQPLHVFNTHGRGLESFLVLGMAIGYSIFQLYSPMSSNLRSRTMFWINTGVLIYFSVNLVFFFMSNYLMENFSKALNAILWNFHALISFALYLFFTIAIYIDWKKAKSPASS